MKKIKSILSSRAKSKTAKAEHELSIALHFTANTNSCIHDYLIINYSLINNGNISSKGIWDDFKYNVYFKLVFTGQLYLQQGVSVTTATTVYLCRPIYVVSLSIMRSSMFERPSCSGKNWESWNTEQQTVNIKASWSRSVIKVHPVSQLIDW